MEKRLRLPLCCQVGLVAHEDYDGFSAAFVPYVVEPFPKAGKLTTGGGSCCVYKRADSKGGDKEKKLKTMGHCHAILDFQEHLAVQIPPARGYWTALKGPRSLERAALRDVVDYYSRPQPAAHSATLAERRCALHLEPATGSLPGAQCVSRTELDVVSRRVWC